MSATITVLGRLTRDPEVGTTQNGSQSSRFDIAVNRKRRGEDVTDYYSVTLFGARAKTANEHLTKGQSVQVVGRLEPNTKDGKTYLNVEGYDFSFAGPKPSTDTQRSSSDWGAPAERAKPAGRGAFDDEDIGF